MSQTKLSKLEEAIIKGFRTIDGGINKVELSAENEQGIKIPVVAYLAGAIIRIDVKLIPGEKE